MYPAILCCTACLRMDGGQSHLYPVHSGTFGGRRQLSVLGGRGEIDGCGSEILFGLEGRLTEVGVLLLEVFAEKSLAKIVLDLLCSPELALAIAGVVVEGGLGAEVDDVERDEAADALVIEGVADE